MIEVKKSREVERGINTIRQRVREKGRRKHTNVWWYKGAHS
jgi:hypothetical protein